MKKIFFIIFLLIGKSLISNSENQSINHEKISLENTLDRFYIIQRIDPCINAITKLHTDFWFFSIPIFSYNHVNYDGIIFSNEHIIGLINEVEKEQSIKPILHMWAEIKRYKYLHDSEMIKEFTQFIFILIRNSFKHQFPKVFETHAEVKTIYLLDTIESLSLDQILDFLDILIENLLIFVQKYELDSSMSWKEWIQKYWLISPFALSALCIKIYFDYKSSQLINTVQNRGLHE